MKAKEITLSALFVALTIILLYVSSIVPTSKLALLTLASCLIPISIISNSLKSSILVYFASTLLSFFLLPKATVLYYSLFFGLYGIIKFFIENKRNLKKEVFLKLIYYVFSVLIFYILSKLFIILNINFSNIILILLFFGGILVFFIYDYALTLIISFYIEKILKHIK